MSRSQRLRARVRSAVKWLVVIPAGIVVGILTCLSIGYFASWLGTQ